MALLLFVEVLGVAAVLGVTLGSKLRRLFCVNGLTDSLITLSGATRLIGTTARNGAVARANDSLTRANDSLIFRVAGCAGARIMVGLTCLTLCGDSRQGDAELSNDLRRTTFDDDDGDDDDDDVDD